MSFEKVINHIAWRNKKKKKKINLIKCVHLTKTRVKINELTRDTTECFL